jgi:hypothetical protein
LSEGMQIAALYHTKMAEELAMLWAVVSSTTKFELGRSRNETFRAEVVDDLVAKFWRQDEWSACLERPRARVCDLILGAASDRAQLDEQLDVTPTFYKNKILCK